MVVMARVAALRVRSGDLVSVRGQWREVKAVRSDRFASGGLVVVLVFKAGPSLRINAADGLAVERGGRGLR
ncbi:hypothetical protein QMK19_18540 [Streptomyces sp. H10-C2]|uniref:hypothetical protein n=1 Tax=unclassified Streptomyces TaxID=2593676 RepID=UPI0024B99BC1|nr:MULTISPECIES: hypothetical protein [unclassified Streptomyces]MDJ0340786.1 hypothetical protein [Streptomyces sp. PH10-H1]MDJ0371626.1 hypothetical protein [Streptomyces sp. H10-C2]